MSDFPSCLWLFSATDINNWNRWPWCVYYMLKRHTGLRDFWKLSSSYDKITKLIERSGVCLVQNTTLSSAGQFLWPIFSLSLFFFQPLVYSWGAITVLHLASSMAIIHVIITLLLWQPCIFHERVVQCCQLSGDYISSRKFQVYLTYSKRT